MVDWKKLAGDEDYPESIEGAIMMIQDLYYKPLSLRTIAERFRTNTRTVSRFAVDRAGVVMRPRGGSNHKYGSRKVADVKYMQSIVKKLFGVCSVKEAIHLLYNERRPKCKSGYEKVLCYKKTSR